MEKVPYAGHPEQCEAVYAHGQCMHKRVAPSKYCEMHGANRAAEADEQKRIKMYKLAVYQNRVDEFKDHSKVKSLRDEIGILRMTLETVINRCKDNTDLMIASNKISDLIMKIENMGMYFVSKYTKVLLIIR